MTRHTPETVRAACERARIPCADVPWFVPFTHKPPSCTAGLWGIGNQRVVSEHNDGALVYDGRYLTDRYHPNEQRAEAMDPRDARIVELEERVRVLRLALIPFAHLGDAHRFDANDQDDLAMHTLNGVRVTVRNYRDVRDALAATEEK